MGCNLGTDKRSCCALFGSWLAAKPKTLEISPIALVRLYFYAERANYRAFALCCAAPLRPLAIVYTVLWFGYSGLHY